MGLHRTVGASALLAIGMMSAATAGATCGGSLYCDSGIVAYEGASAGQALHGLGGGVFDPAESYASPGLGGGVYSTAPASSYDIGSYDMGTTVVSADTGHGSVASTYHSGSLSSGYTTAATSWRTDGMISGSALPGLGAGSELCPVECGSPAVGGEGRVLGCYAVCEAPAPQPVYVPPVPVTRTTYTRVVHPVIYVRYPVPYAAPYTIPAHGTCGAATMYSRYGGYGYGHHGYGGC